MFDGECWSWNRGDLFDHASGWSVQKSWEPFDRFYPLFGFLAGVRDHNVPLIHSQRGVPTDLSSELHEGFGFTLPGGRFGLHEGLFGHSWATGAELVGYDFTTRMRCPYVHGADRPAWSEESCPHEVVDPVFTTVGEYLGDWLERFREIADLSDDPNLVRVVYAFDS